MYVNTFLSQKENCEQTDLCEFANVSAAIKAFGAAFNSYQFLLAESLAGGRVPHGAGALLANLGPVNATNELLGIHGGER